jgi:hypothetical protein
MKILGFILILAGILALAYRGITYTKREEVLDLGPIEATVDQKKTIPIAPVAGALILATGVVLVLVDRRRRT